MSNEPKIDYSKFKGFPKLKENERLLTGEFLEATKELVQGFVTLGLVFKPIVYELNFNVVKLTNSYDLDEKSYKYMDDFVRLTAQIPTEAPVGLLWLKRSLELIEIFLTNVLNDKTCNENLRTHLHIAYQATLEPHHNFVIREACSLFTRLVPSRSYIFGIDDANLHNMQHIEVYLPPLRQNLKQINEILNQNCIS